MVFNHFINPVLCVYPGGIVQRLSLRLYLPLKNTPHVFSVTKPWMSPPLTGHRDDCSGAQRASWHPILSLLSQSLSHPSLPFCLLFRQALMHAYIMGLGKAWGAGTGWVGGGVQEIFRRKHSKRITVTDSFLRFTRGFLQTYFTWTRTPALSLAPKVFYVH